MVYSDTSITHLHSLCINISTAIGTVPAVSSLKFDQLAKSTPVDISCYVSSTSNLTVFCDTALKSPKIYEIKLIVKDDVAGLNLDSQIEYEQYADSSTRRIHSSWDFFATLVSSATDNAFRVHVYKRRSAGGGLLVYYSENLRELVGSGGWNDNHYFSLYRKLGETSTKLLIQDRATLHVGKVFNITDLELETKSIGYYEQLRLQNVNLTVNKALQVQSNTSLYSMYFNPGTAEKNVSDITSTNYLTKYLWLWITLGSIILVTIIIVVCYYLRRETIDKYTITL